MSFSVVIPAYNSAEFISNALDSCLQQTILPEKIIVIDDCSIDNTKEIVKGFKSTLIDLVENPKNMGPSYCRNLGISRSSSSWILFLDADDIFHKEKIKVLNNIILNDHTLCAIGHNTRVGLKLEELNKQLISEKFKSKHYSTFSLLLKNRVVTPALAVNSKNGVLFDERMFYAEDHDFIVRTLGTNKLLFIDIPLCSINRLPLTSGGLSSNIKKMRIGEINMYRNFCRRNGILFLIPFFIFFSFAKQFKFWVAHFNKS